MTLKSSEQHTTTSSNKETVWYWERANLILVMWYISEAERVWETDDTNFYWSDILDAIPEFVLLGDL